MTDTYSNPFSSFFFAGATPNPNQNAALRQKLALAMMLRQRKYPTTLGEGLGAIGDAIIQKSTMNDLMALDKAQQEAAFGTPQPPSPPSATAAPPQRSSYAPEGDATDGGATRAVTPSSDLTRSLSETPVYKESDFNPLDQQAELQSQRAGYLQQLEKDPAKMTKAAALMSAEAGTGVENSSARQMIAETMANRGASRGIGDINKVMDPRYYQPMQKGGAAYAAHAARLQDPSYRNQVFGELRDAFGGGSNLTNLATDNASGDVARNSMANQTLTATSPNGESYFRKDIRPDVHGAGVVPATAAWANRLATAAPTEMVAAQPGGPQPGMMAFDNTPANAPAVNAVNNFAAGQPTTPQIRQAPQPQIAQAPRPDYVMPEKSIPTAPPVIQPSPEEAQLQLSVQQRAINNPYVLQGRDAQRLQQLQTERANAQAMQTKVFENQLQGVNAWNLERQRQLETAAKRAQDYDKAKQDFISGDGRPPSPENQAKLNTPVSPQRTGIPVVPPPPPGISPAKWQEQQGPIVAKAIDAFSQAQPKFNEMIDLINQAKVHPGREWGVGGASKIATSLPGTDAFGFGALMDQIKGKNFLQAYQILKGGGSITEIEGAKSEAAQARLNPQQKENDFNKSMDDFEKSIRTDYERVQRKMNVPVTAWNKPGDNQSSAPDIGTRKGSMEYIGGNPADPYSWRPTR